MENNAENMNATLSELYKKTYDETPYNFKAETDLNFTRDVHTLKENIYGKQH